MGFELLAEVGPKRAPSGDKPSAGPIYRAAAFRDTYPTLDGVTTLYELFSKSVGQYGDADCLGWRALDEIGNAGPYTWWSYSETNTKVAAAGAALKQLGVSTHHKVAVFGANSPEWMVAMQVSILTVFSQQLQFVVVCL